MSSINKIENDFRMSQILKNKIEYFRNIVLQFQKEQENNQEQLKRNLIRNTLYFAFSLSGIVFGIFTKIFFLSMIFTMTFLITGIDTLYQIQSTRENNSGKTEQINKLCREIQKLETHLVSLLSKDNTVVLEEKNEVNNSAEKFPEEINHVEFSCVERSKVKVKTKRR